MSYADDKALELAQKRMDKIAAAHKLKVKAKVEVKKYPKKDK